MSTVLTKIIVCIINVTDYSDQYKVIYRALNSRICQLHMHWELIQFKIWFSNNTHKKIKLKTRCKQKKQNKYKIQFYLFDSISFQWPYLKRMIHSTRHQLLTKDVKVLKIRLKDNEDKWLTVSYHKPDQLQTAWLTVLRTSSLCPSTPPNIATSTSVLMFHNLRLWSANNITV